QFITFGSCVQKRAFVFRAFLGNGFEDLLGFGRTSAVTSFTTIQYLIYRFENSAVQHRDHYKNERDVKQQRAVRKKLYGWGESQQEHKSILIKNLYKIRAPTRPILKRYKVITRHFQGQG